MTTNKALAACRAYVAANAEMRRLTWALGDALSACHGVNGTLRSIYPDNDDETHLKAYWRECGMERMAAEVGIYGSTRPSAAEILAGCPHCQRAEKLVIERKAARQRLGVAKRLVTLAGKGNP